MKQLCEAQVPCHLEERYARHRFIEQIMKNGVDMQRTYTWLSANRSVRIRDQMEESEQWSPVVVPPIDAIFRFTLDAHVREFLRFELDPFKPYVFPSRRSNTNCLDNLDWIEWKAQSIGVKLRAIDFDPIKVPINHPRRAFVKNASRFRGIAIMQDPETFLRAITFGIGDAKTFGFGYLNFTVLG
jgi:hypothetical protein